MSNQEQNASGLDRMIVFRMTSMEEALRDLTAQVGKLVLIEERQSKTSEAVERAFGEIKSLETRILEDQKAVDGRLKALELAQPITNRTNVWVERAAIAIVSSAVAGAVLWR